MIPFYEWFYEIILSSANSVPIQSLWVLFFTNPVDLNRAVQAGTYENGVGYFTLAAGAATNSLQSGFGALFANSVVIPGDGMNVSKLGPEGSGLIKGNISSGRKEMDNLTVSFLDTNLSFTDYNLRPWTIYASHRSLKDPAVKTTITAIQLAKSGPGNPLLPRGIWTFHDACPVSIGTEEYNYGSDKVIHRTVEFAYNYYLLNADPAITAAKTVASVLDDALVERESQPVAVPVGSAGHGSPQIVTPNRNDITTADGHPEGQPVVIPENDFIDRGVNLGLEILNGASNVQIKSDDVVNRLKSEGETLQKQVKVNVNDVPEHSKGTNQVGHIPKEPTGPGGEDPDHIIRIERKSDRSGTIPTGGNSKQNIKDNLDTPLFFPNDGAEGSKKIKGRTVGDDLDTPRGITIPSQKRLISEDDSTISTIETQEVVVERNDTSGRIKTQPVVIDRNDTSGGVESNTVNINREDTGGRITSQPVVVERNDTSGNITLQPVVVERNDTGDRIASQPVVIDRNDTSERVELNNVTIKSDDTAGRTISQSVIVDENDTAIRNIQNKEVIVKRTGNVGINIPLQIITVNQDDKR